jgi:hypothetical protein
VSSFLAQELLLMAARLVFLILTAVGLTQMAFGQAEDRWMPAYKSTTTPTIDGVIEPGEWDAAGPAIFVNQDSPNSGLGTGGIADDVYGGDADLSFSFRAMWAEPWMVYFLIEVTDDIAMEDDPTNLWERDQVEFFMDGDHLTGTDDLVSYEWWQSPEPFGKFGVSRYTTYEGNPGRMTDDQEGLFIDDEINFVNVATVADETGVNGNYVVEYAISLEPMYLLGTFDEDTTTTQAQQLVADHTVVKTQICISDDDNFVSADATTERSHTLCYLENSDWRNTVGFADLRFLSEFSGGVEGDFDGSGALDLADIDDLSAQSAGGQNPAGYDLNGDAQVNGLDLNVWIRDYYNSWVGDANLDGEFNSTDLVAVLASGTYEADVASVWSTGDFNGDGRTNSGDLVAALSDGGYEAGPRAAVAAVPEPAAAGLLLIGSLLVGTQRRRCRGTTAIA